jgi:hypothetical protein
MRLRQSAKNGDQTVFVEQVLAKAISACYSSVPRKTTQTLQSETKLKRGVDEINQMLHNLASSLTDKTICQHAVQDL